MPAIVEDLPTEVEVYMLSFLEDDKKSLGNAGLACRRWLAASREHMYRDVTIEKKSQYRLFQEAVESSPIIQQMIRIFRIDKRRKKFELAYRWVNDEVAPFVPTRLVRCHTLELSGVDESWKYSAFDQLTKFTTITTLILMKSALSPPELYALISSFKNLKSLWIEDYIDLLSDRKDDHKRIYPPSLTRLDALAEGLPCRNSFLPSRERYGVPTSFYGWLLTTPTKHTLRILSLEVGRREIDDIAEFLQEVGPVIEELELVFVRHYGRQESDLATILTKIDLSHNSGLKKVTIPTPSHPPGCILLHQLTNAKVEYLTFRIRCYQAKDVPRIEHDKAHRVLALPHFAELKELCFADEGDLGVEELAEGLRAEYPLLAEKGMLRVEKSNRNTYP